MRLVNNIDVIRIPLNYNNIYYFPKNNNINGKVINNIYCISKSTTDPHNGLKTFQPTNSYITLFDTDGNIVVNNVDLAYFVKDNVTAININTIIDWEKSYINIQDGYNRVNVELLLAITYDGAVADGVKYDSIKSITIPAEYIGSFEQFIYGDWGKLVKIDVLSKQTDLNSFWFSLKDFNGKNFNLCASELFQDEINFGNGWQTTQAVNNPIYLNYLNVNWQDSQIINQRQQPVQIILYLA